MAAVISSEAINTPTASPSLWNKSDLYDLTAGAEEGKGEEE